MGQQLVYMSCLSLVQRPSGCVLRESVCYCKTLGSAGVAISSAQLSQPSALSSALSTLPAGWLGTSTRPVGCTLVGSGIEAE